MSRKEEIIDLCNAIYKENGKINRELCIKYGILRSEIVKYFGNILNMYKEVGYNTKYRRDIPKEEVVQDILDWHKKHLFVDFYIPKINLAIEYDGEQHVRYSKFIHKTYDNFIELKERDILKNKLLEEHNIKLIRIDYKTSYDNIESILSEIISSI